MSKAIGQRYAKALFEISKDTKSLAAVEKQLGELAATIKENAEFAGFLSSPLLGRDEQQNAIVAIATKSKMDPVLKNTLALMAQKGRLSVVPQMITSFEELARDDRGEIIAEVVSAAKLTAAQSKSLAASLTAKSGKTVTLNTTIDESLIGGLVVKMGSTMIDSSVKGKLSKLHNAMKEVG